MRTHSFKHQSLGVAVGTCQADTGGGNDNGVG